MNNQAITSIAEIWRDDLIVSTRRAGATYCQHLVVICLGGVSGSSVVIRCAISRNTCQLSLGTAGRASHDPIAGDVSVACIGLRPGEMND